MESKIGLNLTEKFQPMFFLGGGGIRMLVLVYTVRKRCNFSFTLFHVVPVTIY